MQQPSRRLAWAAPLLVIVMASAAALACGVDVSTAHFENPATYTDPGGQNRTRSFKPADTVYVIVTLKDVDGSIPVKAVWQQVVVETVEGRDVQREVELSQQEQTVTNGPLVLAHAPPGGGAWEKSSYKVMLYLDGDQRATVDFRVK